MFLISQIILNKIGLCINNESTYAIIYGLIFYSCIYLYILFYNNDLLQIFNKFIIYIICIDLLLSALYFYNFKQNSKQQSFIENNFENESFESENESFESENESFESENESNFNLETNNEKFDLDSLLDLEENQQEKIEEIQQEKIEEIQDEEIQENFNKQIQEEIQEEIQQEELKNELDNLEIYNSLHIKKPIKKPKVKKNKNQV